MFMLGLQQNRLMQWFNSCRLVLSHPELVSARQKGTLMKHFGQLSDCSLKCLDTFPSYRPSVGPAE